MMKTQKVTCKQNELFELIIIFYSPSLALHTTTQHTYPPMQALLLVVAVAVIVLGPIFETIFWSFVSHNTPPNNIRKTGAVWNIIYETVTGFAVVDPDGWDRDGVIVCDFDSTPITANEFLERAYASSQRFPQVNDPRRHILLSMDTVLQKMLLVE